MPHSLSPELLQVLVQLNAEQQEALLLLLKAFFPVENTEKETIKNAESEEKYIPFSERNASNPYRFTENTPSVHDTLPKAPQKTGFPPFIPLDKEEETYWDEQINEEN